MPADRAVAGHGGWTMMLADVVALMLAFFVLSFSMRDMVGGERRPTAGQEALAGPLIAGLATGAVAPPGTAPLALAPRAGGIADPLQAPEQMAASSPSLAYLAAVLDGDGALPAAARLWHDDTRLVLELPSLPDDDDGSAAAAARRPLLSLAFLARRFDLDLALGLPAADGHLAASMARALRLRDRLVAASGLASLEVTVGAAPADSPSGGPPGVWAALQLRAAAAAGAAGTVAP